MAVMGGPPESVRTLLDLGVPLSGTSVGPVSILNTAVSSGSLEMVRLLLDRGVPVNAADRSGRTPLHVAAMGQNSEIVRELLRRGASVNARDTHSGAAPLHQAMSLEVAKLLLARPDIDVNARDQKGKTPLMLCRNDPVARLLIERGANIHARDNQGATVLMNAVQQRSLELSRLLLQRGANPLTPDSTGQTPLDEANRSNFPILRDLLQKYSGAKPAKTLPPRELNGLPPAPH
jgi:ankyrin repeat protein